MGLDVTKLGYYLSTSEKYMIGFLGCFIYDSLAVLPQEARLIWRDRRWTVIKAAFLINKYWTLCSVIAVFCQIFGTISPRRCEHTYWILGVFVTFGTFVCDVIVGVRVLAVYQFANWLLAMLGFLFACEITAMIWAVVRLIPLAFPPLLGDFLNYHGCSPINPPTHEKLTAIIYWTPSLVLNLICLGLLIGRNIHLTQKFASNTLLQRLTREGALYFCAIVAVDVTSLYFSAQNNLGLTNINVYTSSVTKSLMCTRLVLGLKHQAGSSGGGGGGGGGGVRGTGPNNAFAVRRELPPAQAAIEARLAPWVPPHLVGQPPSPEVLSSPADVDVDVVELTKKSSPGGGGGVALRRTRTRCSGGGGGGNVKSSSLV